MTEREMADKLHESIELMRLDDGVYIFNDGRRLGTIKNYEADSEHYEVMFDNMTREQVLEIFGIDDRDPETMAKNGWVKLPKDADGKYIHFGDVLDQFGTPMTVYAMSDPDPDQGDCMLRLITDGVTDAWVRARKMRHYHKPTVEDVLRQFTDAILEWAGKSGSVAEVGTWSDVAAEYAAKLRLADDGKEQ